jgi:hypothetical protein
MNGLEKNWVDGEILRLIVWRNVTWIYQKCEKGYISIYLIPNYAYLDKKFKIKNNDFMLKSPIDQ